MEQDNSYEYDKSELDSSSVKILTEYADRLENTAFWKNHKVG